jgi:DNA-directed RNA polymerase specialized sigma24 family protein
MKKELVGNLCRQNIGQTRQNLNNNDQNKNNFSYFVEMLPKQLSTGVLYIEGRNKELPPKPNTSGGQTGQNPKNNDQNKNNFSFFEEMLPKQPPKTVLHNEGRNKELPPKPNKEGGETEMVDSLSYEQRSEMRYAALVKKALSNERTEFFREQGRKMNKETPFNEFDNTQIERFEDSSALEALEDVGSEFQVLKYSVTVRNELLYDAIAKLTGQMRDVILLAYWLQMSDQEIADETGMKRRTVNYNRRKAETKLKEILKGEGYDADNFFPKY